MTAPIVMPDGIRVEVTNSQGDDFVNQCCSITMTHPNGVKLRWTLPKRLLERVDLMEIVCHEMGLELEEKVQRHAAA